MPQGGEQAGLERWKRFLSGGLDRYSDLSREPGVGGISGMSPYLRFGQVSALRMALDARTGGSTGAEAFFEQLVVRREQAFNLVRYREDYDRYLRRRLGAP
jgi:deoxyribodipyrimidine photo-lyase